MPGGFGPPALLVVVNYGMALPPDIRHELAVAAVGEHLQHSVRTGMPEVGWDGDPFLTLAYNKLMDRYELWVEDPGRDPVCVMRSKPFTEEGAPSIQELCRKLAENDLRKISEAQILKRIDDHNLEVQAKAAAAGQQKQTEALEKVYWHVGKEIGEYRPVIGGFG